MQDSSRGSSSSTSPEGCWQTVQIPIGWEGDMHTEAILQSLNAMWGHVHNVNDKSWQWQPRLFQYLQDAFRLSADMDMGICDSDSDMGSGPEPESECYQQVEGQDQGKQQWREKKGICPKRHRSDSQSRSEQSSLTLTVTENQNHKANDPVVSKIVELLQDDDLIHQLLPVPKIEVENHELWAHKQVQTTKCIKLHWYLHQWSNFELQEAKDQMWKIIKTDTFWSWNTQHQQQQEIFFKTVFQHNQIFQFQNYVLSCVSKYENYKFQTLLRQQMECNMQMQLYQQQQQQQNHNQDPLGNTNNCNSSYWAQGQEQWSLNQTWQHQQQAQNIQVQPPSQSQLLEIKKASKLTAATIEIFKSGGITVILWCLPRGQILPMHDHPGIKVCAKVLLGKLKVTDGYGKVSFPEARQPEPIDLLQTLGIQKQMNGSTQQHRGTSASNDSAHPQEQDSQCTTQKQDQDIFTVTKENNLHEVESLSELAVFFEVLFPSYRRGKRDCTYYKRSKTASSTNGNGLKYEPMDFEEEEENVGQNFRTQSLPYQGVPFFNLSNAASPTTGSDLGSGSGGTKY